MLTKDKKFDLKIPMFFSRKIKASISGAMSLRRHPEQFRSADV